jgi:hypothetical protein
MLHLMTPQRRATRVAAPPQELPLRELVPFVWPLVALAALVSLSCGWAELTEPPADELAPGPQPIAPACVPAPQGEASRWQCETVSALEIVSVKVTNAGGTGPWTLGAPSVRAVMRNTTGRFLNYPGVQVAASTPALQPSFPRDSLYGLSGCGDAELRMTFNGTVPSGTPVTFTAIPVHINGDECPLGYPPLSVTVTAP